MGWDNDGRGEPEGSGTHASLSREKANAAGNYHWHIHIVRSLARSLVQSPATAGSRQQAAGYMPRPLKCARILLIIQKCAQLHVQDIRCATNSHEILALGMVDLRWSSP